MKKVFGYITVLSIAILIVLGLVVFIVLPDRTISEKENRSLQTLPDFSFDSFMSGKYMSDISTYFSDQFPARDLFVEAKAYTEIALLKNQNNGVILQNGKLISRPEENNFEILGRNLSVIADFKDNIEPSTYMCVLPRSVDIFEDELPTYYSKDQNRELWEEYSGISDSLGLDRIDIYDKLKSSKAYYNTDHHYTTEGAYITYVEICRKFGVTPYGEADFEKVVLSSEFEGTSMRSSGLYGVEKDTITAYRYSGDDQFTITADKEHLDSFYNMDYLDKTDKYATFMSGNHSRVDISLDHGKEREKLLLIRDSFADCLAPFLARHYDIVMLDLRYFSGNVRDLVSNENISKVLILLNISELEQSVGLGNLAIPGSVE